MELIFKTEKVTDRITRIFAFNSELMYLVEGDNEAALIDTGSGFGSLKKCTDTLTDKPIKVLITHGHTDHALGAAEYDDVYINQVDGRAFSVHSKWPFRAHSGTMWPDFSKLTPDQIIQPMDFNRMKPMKEGDIFDLGGITVEPFALPGHTDGMMAMLIPEDRILLTGDGCNYCTFIYDDLSTSICEYRENLLSLESRVKGRYDRVLLSHGDGNGVPDMIARVVEVCDDIIARRDDAEDFEFLGAHALIAKKSTPAGRLDGGKGNVVYNPEHIFPY